MPSSTNADADRRRSPRFVCGGYAHINCLPSNGIVLAGKVRDLSLGGCCVDTTLPIDYGARAEIVVRVNAASFRALGEVRAVRGRSGAGLEFVQLSTGGKDMLADLITDLARLHATMNKLKLSRRDLDAESIRQQLINGRLQTMSVEARLPVLGRTLFANGLGENREECFQPNQVVQARNDCPGNARIVGVDPFVLTIDLFG